MSEEFYDAEIAPKLLELAKLCEVRKLPFLAVVQYGPDDIGRTEVVPEGASMAFRLASTAARCNGNFDSLAFALKRYVNETGAENGSIVLRMMGGQP